MSRFLFCCRLFGALALVVLFSGATLQSARAQYAQTNLASSIPGLANFLDPQLVNPTGMAFTLTSPIWIANQDAGSASLHQGNGNGVLGLPFITVTGSPTGAVSNPNSSSGNNPAFFVTDGTHTAPSIFLFATTSGQIQGWSPSVGPQPPNFNQGTETGFTSPTAGAMYTGLAVATSLNQANLPAPLLYATDFHNATINAINGSFTSATLPGNFTDPNLPAGYAPFNIANLNGKLFVSYAQQNTGATSEVPGVGNGLIDVFNLDGTLNGRLVSNGGLLNEPWGMAIAPSTFGQFAGDLLVGNHGDGTIDAFDPITGTLLGELKDAQGNPIINVNLWALAFDSGAPGSGFDPNGLFFTSTPTDIIDFNGQIFDETAGLFGELSPTTASATPLPAALPLFGSGLGAMGLLGWRRKRKAQAVAA